MEFIWLEDRNKGEKLALVTQAWDESKDLLTLLLNIQKYSRDSFIDEDTAEVVMSVVGISKAKLYEVLTFYEMLGTKKRGRVSLSVCDSTPCHYNRSEQVVNIIKEELGIGVGETTEDGMFSLRYVPCMGMCGAGPVICAKEAVYGNLTPDKIRKLLKMLASV